MTQTHVRCISLDRRPDRWRLFLERLHDTTLKTLPLTRFRAIDGRRLEEELRERGLTKDGIVRLLRGGTYPSGVLGCLLSHYFLWREIASDETIGADDAVLVFEDDVRFGLTDYERVLADIHSLPEKDWIILYLGGRWWPSFVPDGDWEYFERVSEHVCRRRVPDKSKFGKSLNLDRGLMGYATHKRAAACMAAATEQFLATNPFHAIDHILVCVFHESGSLDYFPHVFYSPLSHDASDAQEPTLVSLG